MTRQARSSAVIMGFDTHMILETVPVLPSTRQNAHQAINRTPRHYAEALRTGCPPYPTRRPGQQDPCHSVILLTEPGPVVHPPRFPMILTRTTASRPGRCAVNAAKLRAGGGCRAGWARRVECVGAVASAGEEAEFGPFAELGVHVARFDSQELSEFAAAPVSRGLAGDDLGDALPPGWWLVWARCPGGVAGAAGSSAGQGRGVHGDVDRGDGGGGGVCRVMSIAVMAAGSRGRVSSFSW